jgi:cellulose biosynthesis protein BcsQ
VLEESKVKTITLCSGKGGVGKTVITTCLARIIQQEERGNVLLFDLDPSVQGLTLLTFQNKYELDHVPFSLADYLVGGESIENDFFQTLQKAMSGEAHSASLHTLYRRLENIFVVPFSTESERPDWTQFAQIEFDYVSDKLKRLLSFAAESLNVRYVLLDTQAGPNSLSLAAATLSDLSLIVLEEDDISWRTALNLLLEISDLNKRLQRRSRSYFLANKSGAELADAAGKLKAFSFLPPLPHDVWLQKLFAKATSAALEKEFENTDFFRQARSRVWQDISSILGTAKPTTKDSSLFSSLFRKHTDKLAPAPVVATKVVTTASSSSTRKEGSPGPTPSPQKPPATATSAGKG